MFKWEADSGEVIHSPPVLRVQIVRPTPNPDYDETKSLGLIAQEMVDKARARIVQWSLAQRQNAKAAGIPVTQTHTSFPGLDLRYTKMQGQEQLLVKVYPVPPLKKGGEDVPCLLILHNTNKVTAVRMDQLNATGAWATAHTATLRDSSWGEELIKGSQYKFDTVMGTVSLSPIKITDNVVSKATHHHICAMRSDLRHFVATNTLAARTPRFNGSAGTYYTPNDVFVVETTDGGSRLVRQGVGGNGAFPYAITATGTYYYAPMSTRALVVSGAYPLGPGSLISTDPFEQHAEDTVWASDPRLPQRSVFPESGYGNVRVDLTDDAMGVLEDMAAATITLSPLALQPLPIDALRYIGPRHGYVTPIELLDDTLEREFPNNDDTLLYRGRAGYGTWVPDEYTVTYSTSVALVSDTGVDIIITTPQQDYSLSLPLSQFSQVDNLDIIEAVFTPVTGVFNEEYSLGQYSLTYHVSALHWTFNAVPGETYTALNMFYLPVPPGGSIVYDWSWHVIPDNPTGFAWLVSYPPSLGLQDGQYYFSDNHVLRTPFGQTAFPEPLEWAAKYHTSLLMWKKYTPWVHLSNGRRLIQGWKLFDERKVFYRHDPTTTPVDITTKLAAVTETTLDKIQALLIDVPLKRIKEFT